MPKIQVYKGRGMIIPVDDAKKSFAYKCPWTREIIATKGAYVKHLQKVRKTIIYSNIRARIRKELFQELINQPSFEQIIKWIHNHPEFLFDTMFPRGVNRYGEEVSHLRDKFHLKITCLDVKWKNSARNSHYCPRNGVTNWAGDKLLEDGTPAPTGYPGWEGRIVFKVDQEVSWSTTDMLKTIGIHTGSGGGGPNKYGYDVRFFASDWPGLEKEILFGFIKNERPADFCYRD